MKPKKIEGVTANGTPISGFFTRLAGRLTALAVLAVLLLSTAGCSVQAKPPVLYVADMQVQAKANEQELIRQARINQTDDMVRMYKYGLIFEDLSKEKRQMDRAFEAHLEKELSLVTQAPLFVKCDMEYFNDSLKKVRDEGWGLEQILADNQDGIREGHFMVYVFDGSYSEGIEELDNVLKKYKGYLGIYPGSVTSVFRLHPDALKTKALGEWREDVNIPYSLKPWDMKDRIQDPYLADTEVPKGLSKKYGEEFVYIYDVKKSENAFNVCAPQRDLNLRFETRHRTDDPFGTVAFDKYLTVLAQKYMGEAVGRIVEKEGLGNSMVYLVIPGRLDWADTDLTPYNTGNIKTQEDELKFLNEGYQGIYDINLIYLKAPEEEVDYAKIQTAVRRINGIAVTPGAVKGMTLRSTCLVSIYDMTDEDKSIAQELFKREQTPSNYFRPNHILDVSECTREETDGFHFLDIYGERLETSLRIVGQQEELPPYEFKRRYDVSKPIGGY